jgi:decaprenylphospho-beta-D-ribofuranose 2-oxidase
MPADHFMIEPELQSRLAGFGNFPVSRASIMRAERVRSVADVVSALPAGRSLIARGSGLAYGDAAINSEGLVLATSRLDKLLEFDAERGLLRCQAGAPLADVAAVALRRGWFLAVTPGTARATVGGCIACDVHGKNHHVAGSFGNHVRQITLLCSDGSLLTCSPGQRPDLFWATVGGMGMTGIILDATLALRRVATSWIRQRNIVTRDLDDTLRVLSETRDTTYSVAWLDATADTRHRGRGVVMLGEHAQPEHLPQAARHDPLGSAAARRIRFPAAAPGILVGASVARLINRIIYRRYAGSDGSETTVPASSFFYPLDAIENWNRLYGRRGFVEYQAVIPEALAPSLVREMLEALAAARQPSFFTSMKRMGKGNDAPLSFPAEGLAFSFDLPVANDPFALLRSFDDKVAAAGGRVYLAKDARTGPDVMDAFYPRRREWAGLVRQHDPAAKLSSDLARRLRLRAT